VGHTSCRDARPLHTHSHAVTRSLSHRQQHTYRTRSDVRRPHHRPVGGLAPCSRCRSEDEIAPRSATPAHSSRQAAISPAAAVVQPSSVSLSRPTHAPHSRRLSAWASRRCCRRWSHLPALVSRARSPHLAEMKTKTRRCCPQRGTHLDVWSAACPNVNFPQERSVVPPRSLRGRENRQRVA
jgi:hypothetical protein